MDDTFLDEEKLYRAVYPPSHPGLFWKKDGTLSPAAFADPKGLSVERGNFRDDQVVVDDMKNCFSGYIVSLRVKNCIDTEAIIKYSPTKRSKYHSEIHNSKTEVLLSKGQRKKLAESAVVEYKAE